MANRDSEFIRNYRGMQFVIIPAASAQRLKHKVLVISGLPEQGSSIAAMPDLQPYLDPKDYLNGCSISQLRKSRLKEKEEEGIYG